SSIPGRQIPTTVLPMASKLKANPTWRCRTSRRRSRLVLRPAILCCRSSGSIWNAWSQPASPRRTKPGRSNELTHTQELCGLTAQFSGCLLFSFCLVATLVSEESNREDQNRGIHPPGRHPDIQPYRHRFLVEVVDHAGGQSYPCKKGSRQSGCVSAGITLGL